jgi:hypothetical protein
MDTESKLREVLLTVLNNTICSFLEFYQQESDFDNIFIGEWTAKQVIMHVTFWHESFARNVRDLALGIKPKILIGTYAALNTRAFEEMGQLSMTEIANRLQHAQEMIQRYILNPKLGMIPYKARSRDYSPEEHLEIVHLHIQDHLKDLKLAGNNRES